MTETFQNMTDTDRKKLLGNIIESCYPHEKEFLYRKYFESGYSEYGTDPYYQSQNQSQASHVQTMLQQYQIIQQQQQDLFAYFSALNGNAPVQVMQVPPNYVVGNSSNMMPIVGSSSQQLVQQAQRQVPQQQPQQQQQTQPSNPPALSFANNHQPSDVDQFFVELFD